MSDEDADLVLARRAAKKWRRKVTSEQTGNLLDKMMQTRKENAARKDRTVSKASVNFQPQNNNNTEDKKVSTERQRDGQRRRQTPGPRWTNMRKSPDDLSPETDKGINRRNARQRKANPAHHRRNSDDVHQMKSIAYKDRNTKSDRVESELNDQINLNSEPSGRHFESSSPKRRTMDTRYRGPGFTFGEPGNWQDDKTLVDCNRYMLTQEIRCDVTVLVGRSQDPVHAHAYVLMSRSSKMATLLCETETEEFGDGYILLAPRLSVACFKDLLTYMYTDELKLNTVRRATELMAAADEFGPASIIQRCFQYLLEVMTSDNVCVILEEGHKRNETDIFNSCMHFILVNAVDVFEGKYFSELCRKCLEDIVKSDLLNANEFVVYNGLVRWAEGQCVRSRQECTDENLKKVLGDLIYHVRFPIMDVKEFTEKLSSKKILPTKEKVELYQYFHGDNYALSEKFNVNHRKVYEVKDDLSPWSYDSPGRGQNYRTNSRVNRQENNRHNLNISKRNPHSLSFDSRFENPDISLPLKRVQRFSNLAGPWLVRGADAISFTCSRPILLRGVSVYGPYIGTDSYTISLTVYDDSKKEIRREETFLDANNPKMTSYDVMLQNSLRILAGRAYTVSVRLKDGKPTYQGVKGRCMVTKEEVSFEFEDSSFSSNGTDVSVGQIPGLLYSIPHRQD